MNKFGKWEYSDSLMISIPASLLPTSAWNWYRVFDRKEKTGIALVPLESNARVIANAPEMYEMLLNIGLYILMENSSPDVALPKKLIAYAKKIRKLLDRIDGEEEQK